VADLYIVFSTEAGLYTGKGEQERPLRDGWWCDANDSRFYASGYWLKGVLF